MVQYNLFNIKTLEIKYNIRDIHETYMRDTWDIHELIEILETYMRDTWEIHETYMRDTWVNRNTWDIHEKYMRHTWEIPEIVLHYTLMMLN